MNDAEHSPDGQLSENKGGDEPCPALPVMDDYDEALFRHGAQHRGHAVEVCNATTGHSVRAIAYCDNAEYARILCNAVNAMLAARKGAK